MKVEANPPYVDMKSAKLVKSSSFPPLGLHFLLRQQAFKVLQSQRVNSPPGSTYFHMQYIYIWLPFIHSWGIARQPQLRAIVRSYLKCAFAPHTIC